MINPRNKYVLYIAMLGFAFMNLNCIYSQNNTPESLVYPDTLWSNQDSFYVTSPRLDTPFSQLITSNDTLNFGIFGHNKGVSLTILTDIDTLTIPHVNFPERQHITIPIASPNDTTVCVLKFQASSSDFSEEYLKTNRGKTSIEIPAVYELANIILYLSDCSTKTGNHPAGTEYTNEVEEYFSKFRNHKLIETLNSLCSRENYWDYYYSFRENSICFFFDDQHNLAYNTPYKHVWTGPSWVRGGEFRNLIYLIQDFVNESDFYSFYLQHLEYYNGLIARQEELLPIAKMKEWIEKEFPQRIDSYKIIFSPLIGGSHSTQKFQNGFLFDPDFRESIMFINSTEDIDINTSYSEELKSGMMSGIVFTEIDHNYVNPASKEHTDLVKNLINNKDFWASKEAQANYSTEYAIFNEYMTHALFCLYIKEHYNKDLTAQIIKERAALMEKRGYLQFRIFNDKFLQLMINRKTTVYESYDEIIEQMFEMKIVDD